MGGGLMQLAADGSENAYLMGNPQITFFKVVHKHHTNFSIESVKIPFDGVHNLSEISTSPTTISVKIPRVGDLLSNILLRVELPNIISSIYKQFRWVRNLGEVLVKSATLFIGGNRVETVTSEWLNIYHSLNLPADKRQLYDVMIGNTPDLYEVVSTDKWSTLLEGITQGANYKSTGSNKHSSDSLEDMFDSMLKVLAESKLKQVSTGKNNMASASKKVRINDISDEVDSLREELPGSIYELMSILRGASCLQKSNALYYDPKYSADRSASLIPSIQGRTLYLPLPFFFTKNIGLSLPLIALQYHEIEIQIELNPLCYLYTIVDWNRSSGRFLRRRPNPLRPDSRLSYFVYNNSPPSSLPENIKPETNLEEVTDNSKQKGPSDQELLLESKIQGRYNDNNFTLAISLEAGFIFLDEAERQMFAKTPHEYLIEQVSVRTETGYHGESSQFEMSLYNPVKELIWVLKRDDSERYNIWFNYTNWLDGRPTATDYYLQTNPYLPDQQLVPVNAQNWKQVRSNILDRAKILFNGIDRFDYKDHIFLSYVQPYFYHSSSKDGIYVVSFSIEPEKYQPSGSVNMSMINTVTLDFETLVPPIDPEINQVLINNNKTEMSNRVRNSVGINIGTEAFPFVNDKQIYQYMYDLRVYVVNYNILSIQSGMAGLSYTS